MYFKTERFRKWRCKYLHTHTKKINETNWKCDKCKFTFDWLPDYLIFK